MSCLNCKQIGNIMLKIAMNNESTTKINMIRTVPSNGIDCSEKREANQVSISNQEAREGAAPHHSKS